MMAFVMVGNDSIRTERQVVDSSSTVNDEGVFVLVRRHAKLKTVGDDGVKRIGPSRVRITDNIGLTSRISATSAREEARKTYDDDVGVPIGRAIQAIDNVWNAAPAKKPTG